MIPKGSPKRYDLERKIITNMGRTHDITISSFDLDRLEAELEAERALADRLAEVLEYYYSEDSRHHISSTRSYARAAWGVLAAWKEARCE